MVQELLQQPELHVRQSIGERVQWDGNIDPKTRIRWG
jgi:hypothetical protein